MLQPGNTGSNTAADHIKIIRRALNQAGLGPRPGRKVLVRTDGAGGTEGTISSSPAGERVQWFVYALVEGLTLMTATDDDSQKIPTGRDAVDLLCLGTWVTVLCQDIGDTSVGSGGDTCGLRLSGEL